MVLQLPWLLALPQALAALWRRLLLRDQDALLQAVRWRLHLRLLLLSGGISAAYGALNLAQGRWDSAALGVPLCLGTWAWLRRRPEHSALIARLNVSAFLALALYSIFRGGNPMPQWS